MSLLLSLIALFALVLNKGDIPTEFELMVLKPTTELNDVKIRMK